MLRSGVMPSEVARRLGHSVDVLMRVYAGVFQDERDRSNVLIEAEMAAQRDEADRPSEGATVRQGVGVDSLLLDPVVELVPVEADELSDLQVVDASLGDEASYEAWADVEMVGGTVDVEKGHVRGRRQRIAKRDARGGNCRQPPGRRSSPARALTRRRTTQVRSLSIQP